MATAPKPNQETLRHRAEEAAAYLPPLLVAAERVASTIMQGVHGRRRVGSGEAFWQFRRYQVGDPVQRIDWRQSAKSGHTFIRETEWEAAQTVWLWCDPSPSMAYASSPQYEEKRHRAHLLLTALAVLLLRGGERVGLYGADSIARGSRASLLRLVASLQDESLNSAGDNSLPPPGHLPRHAHFVLFGDFLSPVSEIEASIRNFAAQGIRGHLVQIVDPAEEDLPFQGRTRFHGLENEGDLIVGRVQGLREAYVRRMDARREALTDLARTLGWTWTYHRTDRPAQAALLSLYSALSLPGTG